MLLRYGGTACPGYEDPYLNESGDHLMRLRLSFLVLLCLGMVCQGSAQTRDVVQLPWNNWSFHLGNDPRCAAVSDPGCVWQAPGTPKPPEGEIWQRTEITLPEAVRAVPQLGLLMQGEWPVYEVFLNGSLIGGSGSFQRRSGPQDSRAIFPFSPSVAPGGVLVVTVHALNLRTALDPMNFTPKIAPMDRIGAIKDEDTLGNLSAFWQLYLYYLIMLAVGIVFLVMFGLDRNSRENLWLGLNLFGLGCLCTGNLATVIDMGISSTVAQAIFYSWNALFATMIIEFSFALMQKPVWLIFRLVEGCGLLFGIQWLYLLPLPDSIFWPFVAWSEYFYFAFRTSLMLAAVARLLPLPLCFKNRLPEMRLIGACLLFISIAAEWRHISSLWVHTAAHEIYFGTPNFQFLSLSYALFAIVMLVAMSARFRRVQRKSQAVQQELAAASAVQQLLLSSSAPSTSIYTLDTVYLPAGEVGGDFFHVVSDPGRDGSLLIVVGDVSGKGLQAALTVSTIIGALRGCREMRPSSVLAHLNRVLCGQIAGFATCCAAYVESSGRVIIANAGNHAPYCSGEELPTLPGLPLGIVKDVIYEETVHSVTPEDRLTFVSDGVVEAQNDDGELFGFERTRGVSARSAGAIAQAARDFGQNDDITVLTLTWPSRVAEIISETSVPASTSA
jgi:phosphoserine phosphatase RsbU/P